MYLYNNSVPFFCGPFVKNTSTVTVTPFSLIDLNSDVTVGAISLVSVLDELKKDPAPHPLTNRNNKFMKGRKL